MRGKGRAIRQTVHLESQQSIDGCREECSGRPGLLRYGLKLFVVVIPGECLMHMPQRVKRTPRDKRSPYRKRSRRPMLVPECKRHTGSADRPSASVRIGIWVVGAAA